VHFVVDRDPAIHLIGYSWCVPPFSSLFLDSLYGGITNIEWMVYITKETLEENVRELESSFSLPLMSGATPIVGDESELSSVVGRVRVQNEGVM
jgi:hypothetical protein